MFMRQLGLYCFLLSMIISVPSYAMMQKPYRGSQDGPPAGNINVANIPNAVPRALPYSKYGNPPSYVVFGKRYYVLKTALGYKKRGIASWYGTKFHKRRTSSGEPYNMFAMTAASKVLPIPCFVRVTNLENGRQIIVKVNDRGPFVPNRIIDLSYVAAKKLGILRTGTGLVEVQTIDPRHQQPLPAKDIAIASHSKPAPHIYMQIGAFTERANADQVAQEVGDLTLRKIRIKPVEVNNRQFYRVQIGPLKNVAESDKLNLKLSHLGLGQPLTVIE